MQVALRKTKLISAVSQAGTVLRKDKWPRKLRAGKDEATPLNLAINPTTEAQVKRWSLSHYLLVEKIFLSKVCFVLFLFVLSHDH